jgi:hypothetical protein
MPFDKKFGPFSFTKKFVRLACDGVRQKCRVGAADNPHFFVRQKRIFSVPVLAPN